MELEASARETLAGEIVQTLRSHGHSAFLVGGCVRDRLLGIVPKDFDVSTSARPDEVCRYFPGAQLVGAKFGVVLVQRDPGVQVEVATFRSEGQYADGRRPDQVQFESDPALDAQRRDFTINGLMQDPVSGEVLDFVGGRKDLSLRLIRAIGDPKRRFEEDHLRMLRALRFAARLGFSIEAQTMAAIRDLAPAIIRISPERIRDELIRILTEGAARRGLELLDEAGLLAYLLPEVKAFQGVQQPPQYHPEGDVWTHVLLMLDKMSSPTPTLAAGVLLHDVGKPPTFRIADRIRFDGHAEVGAAMTRDILGRLRFSKEDIDQITSLVANHMRFKDVENMRTSTLKRFLRLDNFEEHMELHRLDCLASNGWTGTYEFVREKQQEFREDELRPSRLLTGRDLIEAGFQPGPAFGSVLEAVETAQLEGEVTTREEALMLAKSRLVTSG
ncbi:MAG TPA: CCA tRNA nucleotidyltransferase [Bryobacteraceae bacterium]|jgi:poly(A) polymerase|nr:CCA tRNA nucleotidyltransferase [Bryobacteraceae bacterium]